MKQRSAAVLVAAALMLGVFASRSRAVEASPLCGQPGATMECKSSQIACDVMNGRIDVAEYNRRFAAGDLGGVGDCNVPSGEVRIAGAATVKAEPVVEQPAAPVPVVAAPTFTG